MDVIFDTASTVNHFENWRSVFIDGFQVNKLNPKGNYLYGLFELGAETNFELKNEILHSDPNSSVRFAVIDTAKFDSPIPKNISAFRDDFDFYLFMSVDAKNLTLLKKTFPKDGPVLCLSTHLKY